MSESGSKSLWRARELIGSVLVLGWAGFHLWEQWSAFGGREPFVARMTSTSHGGAMLWVEVLFAVLPALAWIGIEVRLLMSGPEPSELRDAMAETPEMSKRLGGIVRVGSWVFFLFLLVHMAWLFLPKLTEGSEPLRAWLRLQDGLGTWPMAIVHALGLTGFAVHVCGAVPRLAIVMGWVPTPESRRAARLSGLIMAVGFGVLYAQLAGWYAAGAGTIWPM